MGWPPRAGAGGSGHCPGHLGQGDTTLAVAAVRSSGGAGSRNASLRSPQASRHPRAVEAIVPISQEGKSGLQAGAPGQNRLTGKYRSWN